MTGLLSPAHIVVLLVVLLLVFGAKRLPELGRSLGSGLREFKTSVSIDPGEDRATPPAPPAPDAPALHAAPDQPAPKAIVERHFPRPAA